MTPAEVRARWPYLTDAEARVVLFYERGLSHRRIAEVLGIAHSTVRDALDRAERRIRRHDEEAAA